MPGAPDRAAFPALFAEHFEHVWHTLRRLGVRPADREDLAQEVFATFHRRRDDYDPARSLRAWLRGIAVRVAVGHRRRARETAEVLGSGGPFEGAADGALLADEKLERAQDHALAVAALAAVEDRRRAVLVMHEVDGLSMPEIAGALGIPLNTAYSRLRLARGDFRGAAQRLLQKRK